MSIVSEILTFLVLSVVMLRAVPVLVEVAASSDEDKQFSAVELLVNTPVAVVGLEVTVREGRGLGRRGGGGGAGGWGRVKWINVARLGRGLLEIEVIESDVPHVMVSPPGCYHHFVLLGLGNVDPPILPELELLLMILPDDLLRGVCCPLQRYDQLLYPITFLKQ